MDAILTNLMTALNEGLLINVYQRDTDDFYTGYVQVLGPSSVVLATYNDAGIADGSVLLEFAAIAQVEFSGSDLASMKFRIQLAQKEKLLTIASREKALQFDATQALLPQLVQQVAKTGQQIMVILADDDAYLEGQVTAAAADRFTFAVFNKFNYTDVRFMQVDFSDVLVVEFQGLDLYLETELVKQRPSLNHVKSIVHQSGADLLPVLQKAQHDQRAIAVAPATDTDQFFVGVVRALNDAVVVLALYDMAAQFGGYAAMRLRGIKSVTTASDYLQTISAYRQWDEAHDFTQQPVLNAEREFDSSDDMIANLINEAASFQRVMRVRLSEDDTHLLGVPLQVTATDFMMDLIDGSGATSEQAPVRFDQVDEIAFGHIYAYMQEAELRHDEH